MQAMQINACYAVHHGQGVRECVSASLLLSASDTALSALCEKGRHLHELICCLSLCRT